MVSQAAQDIETSSGGLELAIHGMSNMHGCCGLSQEILESPCKNGPKVQLVLITCAALLKLKINEQGGIHYVKVADSKSSETS